MRKTLLPLWWTAQNHEALMPDLEHACNWRLCRPHST
jgi:hypothetical protein